MRVNNTTPAPSTGYINLCLGVCFVSALLV